MVHPQLFLYFQLTSGAWLLAKNKHAARDLSMDIQQHKILKTYLAIVRAGRQSFPATNGTIDAPISIDGEGNVEIDSVSGLPAVTHWEVLGSSVCFEPL